MTPTTTTRQTTKEWLQEIGGALRTRRIRADLTQADLARRADVSLSTLQHLESGTNGNLTSLVKVVRALGAEDWLTALAPPAEPTVSPMQLLRERRRTPPTRRRVRKAGG